MKEVFLTNSIKFITKYNNKYTSDDIDKIKYGLEGLYLTITKLIIIFILAILFGFFKELIIMLIFFNIIRFPAFGFHADKSYTCLIISIILILGLTYFMIKTAIPKEIQLLISIICTSTFIIFAPADTVKRPLTNKKKRKYRKIASCICAVIYTFLIFFIKNNILSNLILTSLIIETIMINPITYKIFGMPYNNYKKLVKT